MKYEVWGKVNHKWVLIVVMPDIENARRKVRELVYLYGYETASVEERKEGLSMNFEKFEKILRWKYDNGKRKFIGNLSGNKYEIQNKSGYRFGYTLFVNGSPVKVNCGFFGITCGIWDREMEYGKMV